MLKNLKYISSQKQLKPVALVNLALNRLYYNKSRVKPSLYR